MIEANTTHRWQMPGGIDASFLRTSNPASLFRSQSELGRSRGNETNAHKQADTVRLQLTLRRPVVLHSRHESADLTLNQNLSGPRIGTCFSCLDASSGKTIFNIHADMGVSMPVPAFSHPNNPRFVPLT